MAVFPSARAMGGSTVALPARSSPAGPWSGCDKGVVAITEDGFNGRERPPAVSTTPLDDVDLARRLGERDPTALAALYDLHAAAVHGLTLSILRNPQLAEEVTHDVFLRLWQRPDAFDARRGGFAAWLLRVARNRSIDLLRRQRERPFPSVMSEDGAASDPTERLVDPDPGPADQAIRLLVSQDVRAALTHLSPDQSHLLQLAYFEGLTQREIAFRLHRPLGTVKSQIRVAMHRLADLLAPPDPPVPPADVDYAGQLGRTTTGRIRRGVTEDAP